ncbi:MAG: SidA/IucD/PvdA family monooxygenase [Acidimicrobiia bacterium]|nr:SidA/IucD/PvdA family monooxygenase [Acidimicrobiia bacterium]
MHTVVIGGSQAGLATGYHLKRLGVDHVILDENDEVGASWRNRWESLHLFTPARYSCLPGMPSPLPPRSRPGKDDIADYLRTYSEELDLPVRTAVRVERVAAEGDGYVVEATDGDIRAHNVVIATGAFHNPRIPEFAETLHLDMIQMHSSEYRSPAQAQEGGVLVVGAGQSGAEIALDLVHNHQVWLSGNDNGEEPTTPDTFADRLLMPLMWFVVSRVVNVANPIGRKARDHFLYPPRGIPRAGGTKKKLLEAGVEWVPRTTGSSDGHPVLEDGRVLDVANVVWCTGFVTDYSWVDLPVFDDFGYPTHDRGVVESQPGLYFMGLPFQSTLSSALVGGMGRDAEYIAEHLSRRRSPAGSVAFATDQESRSAPGSGAVR